jgi:hypothetical protein
MHAAEARRHIRRSQLGAVVLLGLGASTFLLPTSCTPEESRHASDPSLTRPQQIPTDPIPPAEVLTARLEAILPPQRRPDPPRTEVATTAPAAEPAPPPPPPPPPLRYIGAVMNQEFRRAVVVVNGTTQKLVAEGDALDANARVKRVLPDALVIVDPRGQETRIELTRPAETPLPLGVGPVVGPTRPGAAPDARPSPAGAGGVRGDVPAMPLEVNTATPIHPAPAELAASPGASARTMPPGTQAGSAATAHAGDAVDRRAALEVPVTLAPPQPFPQVGDARPPTARGAVGAAQHQPKPAPEGAGGGGIEVREAGRAAPDVIRARARSLEGRGRIPASVMPGASPPPAAPTPAPSPAPPPSPAPSPGSASPSGGSGS